MTEMTSSQEVRNQPKEFSSLDLPDQVKALCLAALEMVDSRQVTEWIVHSRGELTPEQNQTILNTYTKLSGEIMWGDEGNNSRIESELGIKAEEATNVIVETALAKIPDFLKNE